MKRLICICISVAFFFTLLSFPVLANANVEIQPRYTYILGFAVDITVDTSSSEATCYGMIRSRSGSVKLVCQLQKKVNNQWITTKSWTETGDGFALINKKQDISVGLEYRVLVTGYVYDTNHNLLEKETASKVCNN